MSFGLVHAFTKLATQQKTGLGEISLALLSSVAALDLIRSEEYDQLNAP